MIDYDTLLPLARRLREQGNTYREIAAKLGVAETAVHKWLTQPGFTPPTRYSDEDKARWAADADGTRTRAELSALWGISEADVRKRLGMLRINGYAYSMKPTNTHAIVAAKRYAELLKDIYPGVSTAELAEKWGMTLSGTSDTIYRMRQAGIDVPTIGSGISALRGKPKPWHADCDGTRTVHDLATLWGIGYDSAHARIERALSSGFKLNVKPARAQQKPAKPAPAKRQKKAVKPPQKPVAAPRRTKVSAPTQKPAKPAVAPVRPRVEFLGRKLSPSKIPAWAPMVGDVAGRTIEDLAELWGATMPGTMVRLRAMVDAGAIEAMPARRPKPPTEHQQRMQAVKDQRAQWAAEADGTRTTDELCSLWGTTPEGVWDRVRNLRKRGFAVSVSRDRKAPVRVERPRPVAEPVMQSSYVPTMHLALPKVPWLAMGVCNVLGWPWVAFEQTVKARTGETIRPGDMLSDEHAQRVLGLFGFFPEVAA